MAPLATSLGETRGAFLVGQPVVRAFAAAGQRIERANVGELLPIGVSVHQRLDSYLESPAVQLL